ncbi:MAG TPA: dehydrogenase E1 component subunit alpha/beta [Terriglobales bacterium]
MALYRVMRLSRRLDDREILLKRQQKIFFQISAAGHEAVQAAAGDQLRPGYDWLYPYYRDRTLCLRMGVSVESMLLQGVGAAADPASGGRQMPSHWSDAERHIVSSSSPTGTQFLQAVGCADGGRYLQRHPEVQEWLQHNPHPQAAPFEQDEVVLVSAGEGATSEGEFWEAINGACRERLPVVFLIQDNGYAISVPAEMQAAGVPISEQVERFPHLRVEACDGCDLIASYGAMARAIRHCRAGAGPALVHAQVVRLYSHSFSEDQRQYRHADELEADAARDPLARLRQRMLDEGWATETTIAGIEAEIEATIATATETALASPPPSPATLLEHVYSSDVDPTSDSFVRTAAPSGSPMTMVDLINATLQEEMERDPRVLVFGEDVADGSRIESLKSVIGKGGVFKVTAGLQRQFGDRVFNTSIAEAAIVGRATGMATRGLKPVPEIQFFDYIWPAMMQIRDELAVLRWRSMGAFAAPLVLRIPIGGYLTGGAIYHSQSGESIFTHIPGLRVIMPATAVDACGLLRTALRSEDPVLFLEHKRLYREPFNRGAHPGKDFCIPFGRAAVARTGTDLTVITYGALVQRALQAAERLAREGGAEVEVLDLRSLAPYDWEAIAASVKKTSRVLVAHEDTLSWGYGAEIAARIGEELFEDLDAPVRRVAAQDVYCPYQPGLEEATLPQTADLHRAMGELLRY